MRRNTVASAMVVVCGCGAAAAQTPAGSAFTYQGRLTQNGQPADGLFDFYIHLYDSAVGGSPTSPLGLTLEDVLVTDGLFTATLDFGAAALNGDARWLNIQVRSNSGLQFYTQLSPRQPLTPAPYAVRALNEKWTADGGAIRNTNTGFVGVNRSTPVTSAEFFGIQAPVTGYGGMYIATDGAAGKPFYGYSAGAASAWSYLDGGTGSWHLHNDGIRMTVTDTGNVGIGQTDPTGRLHVVSPSQPAGLFEITSAVSLHSAVSGLTNGQGAAVSGRNNGSGRAGSFLINNPSSTAPALEGTTDGAGSAIYAKKLTNTSGAALSAEAATPGAVALNIVEGAIRCQGAGLNTNTFAFKHTCVPSGSSYTFIDNPQTNGKEDALLFVTPNFHQTGPASHYNPPVTAYWWAAEQKWSLVTLDQSALNQTWTWNIMVIRP